MKAAQVRASELMQREVACLDAGTPVDEAVSMLESDGISGAPVVDGGGRVVGVLSLTDVARAKEAEATTVGSRRSEYYLPHEGLDEEADEFSYKDDYSPAALPTGTVAEWMSTDLVFVDPADSLVDACRTMSDNGVHRVLVLEDKSLVGILSSFDVVRWVADNG